MVVRYGAERVYLSCYFPMPFFRSAKIELAGAGENIKGIDWTVRYQPFKDAAESGGLLSRDIPRSSQRQRPAKT